MNGDTPKSGVQKQWIWATVAWMALLTSLSAIPAKAMPHWEILSYDKVVHTCFYMPLGWCIMLSLGRKVEFRYGVMMMIVMLFGGFDEIHQHFVPGRVMDVWDWTADSIGGALGGFLVYRWERYRDARKTVLS